MNICCKHRLMYKMLNKRECLFCDRKPCSSVNPSAPKTFQNDIEVLLSTYHMSKSSHTLDTNMTPSDISIIVYIYILSLGIVYADHAIMCMV
jgi:hypothetical protein